MTAPSRFYSKRSKRPLNAEQALAEIVTQPGIDAACIDPALGKRQAILLHRLGELAQRKIAVTHLLRVLAG